MDQAAAEVGVSRRTIYRAIEAGELPSRVVRGRRIILAKDLREWRKAVDERRDLLGY